MGELLREEISFILTREMKDPRVDMVSLTTVRVSDDLSYARVYFVTHGGETERKRSYEGLKSAQGFIRRELRKRLPLRIIPEIDFRYDDSLDYGEHIDQLLRSIKAENS